VSESAALTLSSAAKSAEGQARVLQRKCACGSHAAGEECEECRKKKGMLQRKARRESDPGEAPSIVHQVLSSPGRPLGAETRAFMEMHLGRDLSSVRVHTGSTAAASAEAIDAEAYTVGQSIVFAADRYAPQSWDGRELLAHELAHVLQQSRGVVSGPAGLGGLHIAPPDGALEHQAEKTGADVHRQPMLRSWIPIPPVYSGMSGAIQRKPARSARRAPSASRGPPIVEDGRALAPGQMHRSQFLTTLRDTLLRECEVELAPFGRTAKDCPYILRTIERYASRPIASLMRLIRHFGKPPAGADAHGLIRAVTQQARTVARRVGEKRPHRVQASTDGRGPLRPHDPNVIVRSLGGGAPLQQPTLGQMERGFGADFEPVRVHVDATADRLNTEVGARAFTVGSDIAFAAGQYQPGTSAGDMLIAHELTHTIQQRSRRAPPAPVGDDRELERQADRAASMAIGGSAQADISLAAIDGGLRVQRWPAVVAGALLTAEVGTEAVVITEVAAVSTEVVVAEGALTLSAELAAPAVVETLAPVAVETLAPTALETVATTGLETTATVAPSTVSSTAAATIGVGAAATMLSGDSPVQSSPQDEEARRRCFEVHPQALPCAFEVSREEQVQDFLMNQGYGFEALGNCSGLSSHAPGAIRECNGAPGESWHCDVHPYFDAVAGRQYPGGIVSIFSCLCCRADGSTGWEWMGAHWSPGR
jgi:hypothetical protein